MPPWPSSLSSSYSPSVRRAVVHRLRVLRQGARRPVGGLAGPDFHAQQLSQERHPLSLEVGAVSRAARRIAQVLTPPPAAAGVEEQHLAGLAVVDEQGVQ